MEEDASSLDESASGDYFVSLTDLMTGVVFIFVILLTAYAVNFRTEKERSAKLSEDKMHATEKARVAEAVAKEAEARANEAAARALEYENNLKEKIGELKLVKGQIDALAKLLRDREQSRRAMLEELAARLESKGVRVRLDVDNGIIRLPESLLFRSGEADLRQEGKDALRIVGRQTVSILRKFSETSNFRLESIFIEGHTDSVPIHNANFRNNGDLSAARAVRTSEEILDAAPALRAMLNPSGEPMLGISGYGENRPVAPNTAETGKQLNRRIDIRFIMAYPTAEQFERVQDLLSVPVNDKR
jgi:flagellar motor protein MotB